MKIRTNTGKSHIKVNPRQDGRPGLVISQCGKTVLMSEAEWLELREHADAILGLDQPEPRKRGGLLGLQHYRA